MKFAGLQNSRDCYCGNDAGRFGSSTRCNSKCAGNQYLICGGSNENSIFLSGTDNFSLLLKIRTGIDL